MRRCAVRQSIRLRARQSRPNALQTSEKMIGVRDPLGIRPLVLGDLDGQPVLASETCALDMIGARFVRDIEHGEMVVIEETGVTSSKPFQTLPARPCVFEYVYFARPDSVVNGRSVYGVRKRMGQTLAKETGVEADVVVPVPDSGVPAALGYAQESGLPFEMGIIRNHYVGRTFIQPTQGVRELGVRMKHSPNRAILAGKRVVLIDDSIVRGTTSLKIVRMVREAGATEVHLRSASPPIKWPDFYGIDMPEREQLLAANKSLEEMAKFLEVDSLGFLSVDGLYEALEAGPRDPATPQFTDHYFTGDYPTRLTDREIADLQSRNGALSDRVLVLEGMIKNLQGATQKNRLTAPNEAEMVDARIVGINAAAREVYLSIGRSQHVVVGMPFEVYSRGTSIRPDADGQYPAGKASVEVVRIDEGTCVARIIREARGNPIIDGDFVANAVYDPNKKYVFTVYGNFDANRDGIPTPGEAADIRALIDQWGGTVRDDIGGDTDFLVLGTRPVLPPEPKETDPVELINRYLRLKQAVQRYDDLFETARRTGIPVLNQNRFETLTGQHGQR